MRVIDEPSAAKWEREITCTRCESRLAVEIGDFKRTVYDQRDGNAAVFQCPTCRAEQWVDLALIPKALHHRLPR